MDTDKKTQFRMRLQESLPVIVFGLLLVAIIVTFRIMMPGFLKATSVYSILRKIAGISLAAAGLTFIIIIGKVDMSFHLIGCSAGICFSYLMVELGFPPIIAVLGTMVYGGAWGSVTGLLVSKLKFPDIITSIAVGSIAFGAGVLV